LSLEGRQDLRVSFGIFKGMKTLLPEKGKSIWKDIDREEKRLKEMEKKKVARSG